MAEINGAWTPENEDEKEFIFRLNALCGKAFEEGVAQEDIVGGLSFMAAALGMQDPEADPLEGMPEPSESRRETCPVEDCDAEIRSVRPFIGGRVIVEPCGHRTHVEDVPGWVETPWEDGDD
jgi:hypothetical protein